MTDEKAETGPTLVEKWIRDQQEWQKTAMEYFDSMVQNDEFLVHLGNAMRGSLLAGKPYPGTERPGDDNEVATMQKRLDEMLHALHELQGQLADLTMELAEMKSRQGDAPLPATPARDDSGRRGD